MAETTTEVARIRPHLIASYVDNMVTSLKLKFPNADEKELTAFVKSKVSTICKESHERLEKAKQNGEDITAIRDRKDFLWPTFKVIKHIDGGGRHSYGNTVYFDSEDLLDYVTKHRNKIISPFGTFYETTDRVLSFLKGMIDENTAGRKREKKLMLQAKKEGNRIAETYHNNNQATLKINNNSTIGAFGSGFNFLSNIANFNSVTSIARFFIMNSYAHAERFLESNFYFRTIEQLINFIITCKKKQPNRELVVDMCNRNGIHIPSSDEVYEFLCGNLHKYMFPMEHPDIKAMLNNLHPGELAFLFYMSNMKQLVFKNEEKFRNLIKNILTVKNVDFTADIDASAVGKLDGDLVIVLSTIHSHLLPVNERGNAVSVYDCIDQYPEVAKQLGRIGQHMQKCLDSIQDIFNLFMNHKVGIGYVSEHKHMFRDTVILSDTDSIIFTTKSWCQWYKKDLKLNADAYAINALVVYWLSKANAFIMYNVSEAFGALGKDLKTMQMKNEFMMPIMILTSLKKHYMSFLAIQEGVIYKKPRLDIKGVNLRGSNFSKGVLNFVTWFIQRVLDEIMENGEICIAELIKDVLRFERFIYDSLWNGETRFLNVEPVKSADEYKDAERTLYFNYLFWQEVFAKKYGDIVIPTKCFVLPLTGLKDHKFIHDLENESPEIADSLKEFTSKYKKEITRIPINPLITSIPTELRQVTNYKSIIYSNARPLYLVLQSFGIGVGNGKNNMTVFSDIYGWVTGDEGRKVKDHFE